MVYLVSLLLIFCFLTITVGQLDLSSPCPKIFNYETDGRDWYGTISVPSPGLGPALKLNLKMSIKTKLPTKYVGRIELLGERGDLLHRLLNGLNIDYKVYFPLPYPIPKVTEINFNGAIICVGPPAAGQFVTTINLDHVLYTGNQEQQQNQQIQQNLQRPDTFLPQVFDEDQSISYFPNGQKFNPNPSIQNGNMYNTRPTTQIQDTNIYFHRPGIQNDYNFNTRPTVQTQNVYRPQIQQTNDVYNPRPQIQPENVYNSRPQIQTNNLYNLRPQIQNENVYNSRPPIQTEGPSTSTNSIISNVFRPSTTIDFSDDIDEDRPNPDTFARPNRKKTTNAYPEYSTRVYQPQLLSPNLRNTCGKPQKNYEPLIYGGDDTERGDWPWLVAMFSKKIDGIGFICSGTLVSDRHVVTAGHCLQEKGNRRVNPYEIILKLGAHNIQDWTDQLAKTTNVEQIIFHPEFNASLLIITSDIAVLIVKPVQFNNYIMPICIWEGNDNLNRIVGQEATVVGWGRDEKGLIVTPEPRKIEVPIVSTVTCRASDPEFFRLTSSTTLCAGGRDGKGPCKGDSGGGLYMTQAGRWMLRGIVSASLAGENGNACNLLKFVVYTDAAKYASWIRGIVEAG